MDHESREGYGANKVAAEHVLLDSGRPVTVLRPSKVHGAGAARPREWIFVKPGGSSALAGAARSILWLVA